MFLLDTCEEGLFSCTRISQCVLEDRTCNGIVDCRDGTDEQSAGNCCKYITHDVRSAQDSILDYTHLTPFENIKLSELHKNLC